jgi:hypothetical protein
MRTIVCKTALLAFVAAFLVSGCFLRYSEEERADIQAKCENRATISRLHVMFIGFAYAQMERIEVKAVRAGEIVDSFTLYPDIDRDENGNVTAWMDIFREFTLSDEYHFTVPGARTFVLTNMKMGLWPQFTMLSEGYGCVVRAYTVDGKNYPDCDSCTAYPIFYKDAPVADCK